MMFENGTGQAAALQVFSDEKLVGCLHQLWDALNEWAWIVATESANEEHPDQVAERVVGHLENAVQQLRNSTGNSFLGRTSDGHN